MLKKLAVKSFAIIEDLTVSFTDGMTVLTGQTGAGKSLIIDTISLLLGARADSDMVRYGDQKASIEGEFTYENKKINNILIDNQIPILDNIYIKREININGKNTIKINDTLVNLVILKSISQLLADIHVQHDTYMLINPQTYLNFIDPIDDDSFNNIFNSYIISLNRYLESKKSYDLVLNSKKDKEEKLEFLLFQKQELSVLNLQKNEDIELEEKINKLSNFDKIFNNLKECYENLENEDFSIESNYSAYENLNKIASYDQIIKVDSEKLQECYYILEDVKSNVKHSLDNLDFDANELDILNERLNEINNLKKKYKLNLDELLDYLKKITFEIELATNYDEVLKDKYNELCNNHKALVNNAKKLTNYRKTISNEISESIIKECRDLDLPNTNFNITFNENDFSNPLDTSVFKQNGSDEVDFMISLNLGEPLKSLHKTASGGEMSRIMLAFKTYFSKKTKLSVMVFDEIDSGISGSTAVKISQKMKQISKYTQVLCITHLPQVAAIGDNHLFIFKEEENGRTKTNIEKLSIDRRIEEIAIMIGGNKISKYALEHAKELIEQK